MGRKRSTHSVSFKAKVALEERQVDAAARIAAEADAGNMPVLTLEAWKARVEERRKNKQV